VIRHVIATMCVTNKQNNSVNYYYLKNSKLTRYSAFRLSECSRFENIENNSLRQWSKPCLDARKPITIHKLDYH